MDGVVTPQDRSGEMLLSLAPARQALSMMAVAAVLGLGSLALAPAPAHAEDNQLETKDRFTGCWFLQQPGFKVGYPEGTRITIETPNGNKETYRCVNGDWVPEASGATAGPSVGTFYVRTATFSISGGTLAF